MLRRQRAEQAAAAQAEAEEIARAIAEAAARERREAEEAERLEQERLREEAELARLEQIRLEEEAKRREEAERAERELRDAIRLSLEEAARLLHVRLQEVAKCQRDALDGRHLSVEEQHVRHLESAVASCQKESDRLLKTMQNNIDKRTKALQEKHQAELETFDSRQQDQEDDLFLQIQLHLRGKPNKEARERRLQDELHRQQEEERQQFTSTHQSELGSLQQNTKMEIEGLKQINESNLAHVCRRHRRDFDDILKMAVAERTWFEVVAQRRQNMVREHNRLMMEDFDAGRDTIGLTEELAMAIEPFIPALAEQGVNGSIHPAADHVSASEPLTELAVDSESVFTSSDASQGAAQDNIDLSGLSGSGPLSLGIGPDVINSAWTWMTGNSDDVVSLSSPQRPQTHHVQPRDLPKMQGTQTLIPKQQEQDQLYQTTLIHQLSMELGHLRQTTADTGRQSVMSSNATLLSPSLPTTPLLQRRALPPTSSARASIFANISNWSPEKTSTHPLDSPPARSHHATRHSISSSDDDAALPRTPGGFPITQAMSNHTRAHEETRSHAFSGKNANGSMPRLMEADARVVEFTATQGNTTGHPQSHLNGQSWGMWPFKTVKTESK